MTVHAIVYDGGSPQRRPSVSVSARTSAPLGDSGITVSRLAFGAWGLAGSDWGGHADLAQARRTIERAIDLGITLFDTAPSYGRGASESLLGLVLGARDGGARRARVVLATKCGPRDDPRASLEASLRRLRTDHVDLLQLHEVPAEPDELERRLERMHSLVERGAARAIGVCNATSSQLARALAAAPLVSYQGQYNLLDRDAEHDTLPIARTHGVAFLAYRPLASGLLTGKYATPPRFDQSDHRARIHWFRGREFERRRAVLETLRAIARARALTAAQLALAWALARPGVTAVLAGARTVEQLEENTLAARVRLSAADVAAIDAAVSDAYEPRALRGGVEVAEAPDAAGEVHVTVRDRGAVRTLTVGPREAYVMRRLDGRTPYTEIAAGWQGPDGERLLAAQVILLVDQLADLGLAEERGDA